MELRRGGQGRKLTPTSIHHATQGAHQGGVVKVVEVVWLVGLLLLLEELGPCGL